MVRFRVVVRAAPQPYNIGQNMTLEQTYSVISLCAATAKEAERKAEVVVAELFQYRRWGLEAQAKLVGQSFGPEQNRSLLNLKGGQS